MCLLNMLTNCRHGRFRVFTTTESTCQTLPMIFRLFMAGTGDSPRETTADLERCFSGYLALQFSGTAAECHSVSCFSRQRCASGSFVCKASRNAVPRQDVGHEEEKGIVSRPFSASGVGHGYGCYCTVFSPLSCSLVYLSLWIYVACIVNTFAHIRLRVAFFNCLQYLEHD